MTTVWIWRIVEYDPAWPRMAEAEIARIGAAVGEVAVRIVQQDLSATIREQLAAMSLAQLAEKVAQQGRGQMYYI